MKCDISSCNYFFKALKSTKYCNHLLLLFILTLKNKVFSFAIPTNFDINTICLLDCHH